MPFSDPSIDRTRALERFEAQIPLLKLLVSAMVEGFPGGAAPLLTSGAIALWRAALAHDDAQDGSFGPVAERAIQGAVLGHLHSGVPLGELPAELERHASALEAFARSLDLAETTALAAYTGPPPARVWATGPLEEFVTPPSSTQEGRLLWALRDLFGRRWPLILAVVLATEGLVLLAVVRTPPTFKATTVINTGIASGQSVSGAAIDWFKAGALMGNLTEMLSSRTVLERTIARLNLATTPEKLAKQIDVEKVGQTDMMRISATAPTAKLASDLANTHTDEFLRYYRQSQGADAKQADAFIVQQLASSSERLRQAEDRLKRFKSENVPEAQTTYAVQLGDLRAQAGESERALASARSGLATIESELRALKRDPMAARVVRDSAEVDAAGERLRTLKQNLADAEGLYGANSSVVRSLKAQIAKAGGTLQSTTAKITAADPAHADVIARRIALKVEIAEQEAKFRNLTRAIAELEPRARSASTTDVTYKELQREVAVRETEYQHLAERSSQTRLAASGASLLPITVVDSAQPPRKPESSKAMIKLALGMLLSLLVGLVLAYLMELAARPLEPGTVDARLEGEEESG